MRMKRPQGYKHIKCPHCGEKIRIYFRTMHRMKIEVDIPPRQVTTFIEGVEVEEGG